LLVFVPDAPSASLQGPGRDPLLRELVARPLLDVGLIGATQGSYSPEQTLLDITQGTRVSPTAYTPRAPGRLTFAPRGGGGIIRGWRADAHRAGTAPGKIEPGRLGSAIPGGAAFAGVAGAANVEA